MKTTLKIAAALTILTGLGVFAALVTLAGSNIALQERFPHLDYKVVHEANLNLIKRALRGELKDYDTNDDDVMDELFLEEVARLTSK